MFSFKAKDKHIKASYDEYYQISKMFNEILTGPLADTYSKSDSSEFSYDGYRNSRYEDNLIEMYSYSGTGIGMGRTSGTKRIILKDYGCVYDEEKAIDTNLWYEHLVDVYNRSIRIKERKFNLYHKMEKLFDHVDSGYSDGIIKVEYEKLTTPVYSESEAEYVDVNSYTCKIFLIPLNQYVYVRDEIYHKLDKVTREGKWVDYVSTLIDNFETEKNRYFDIEMKNRKRQNELKKQKKKMKTLINNSPIDDSEVFKDI